MIPNVSNKRVWPVACLLIVVTTAFSRVQITRNTLAEKQLHGAVAKRVEKRFRIGTFPAAGDKNDDRTQPYARTEYTYGKDGNLLEARYHSFYREPHLRAVLKPEFISGHYTAFKQYDSSGAIVRTGKVTWLNDTTYAVSVYDSAGKIISADSTWLNGDYSVKKIVSVYEKENVQTKNIVYYENGWPVKSIIEIPATGEQTISTCQNIVLEKDILHKNPVKMYIITDNRDTVLVITDYEYFGAE